MAFADKDFFDRWLLVKETIEKNENHLKNITKIINYYYYKTGEPIEKIGDGESHIIFPSGKIVIPKINELFLALKLQLLNPYRIYEDGFPNTLIEQIVGFDETFKEKTEKNMPYFIGIVSWENNLGIITEDISSNSLYSLSKPFNINEEFTHAIRIKDGIQELFFLDPLIVKNEKFQREIFEEYMENCIKIPSNLIFLK